jgi:threonine dehydratase
MSGAVVLLKRENHQWLGALKVQSATEKLSRLSEAESVWCHRGGDAPALRFERRKRFTR